MLQQAMQAHNVDTGRRSSYYLCPGLPYAGWTFFASSVTSWIPSWIPQVSLGLHYVVYWLHLGAVAESKVGGVAGGMVSVVTVVGAGAGKRVEGICGG